MAEYLTNDTDLKKVADAIRTKAGSTAKLSFPAGFVNAVNGIQKTGGVNVSYNTIDPDRYSVNLDNWTAQLDLTGLVAGSLYICNMTFLGVALDSQNTGSTGDAIKYNITMFSTGNEQSDFIFCSFMGGYGDGPIQYNSTLVLNLDILLDATKNDYDYGMAYNITKMINSTIVSWN